MYHLYFAHLFLRFSALPRPFGNLWCSWLSYLSGQSLRRPIRWTEEETRHWSHYSVFVPWAILHARIFCALPGSSKWPRLDPQVTFWGLKWSPFRNKRSLRRSWLYSTLLLVNSSVMYILFPTLSRRRQHFLWLQSCFLGFDGTFSPENSPHFPTWCQLRAVSLVDAVCLREIRVKPPMPVPFKGF